MSRMCHKLVKETAEGMATAVYEEMMSADNKYYQSWKRANAPLTGDKLQLKFIERNWPRFIEQARSTLAEMLARNIPEALKAEISNALILDNSVKRGRKPGRLFHA